MADSFRTCPAASRLDGGTDTGGDRAVVSIRATVVSPSGQIRDRAGGVAAGSDRRSQTSLRPPRRWSRPDVRRAG